VFTGLVQSKAVVKAIIPQGSGCLLQLETPKNLPIPELGDSIATNGCCLTVTRFDDQVWEFEAGAETLSRTSLGKLSAGSFVNLETSMKLGDKIGGHLVTGHVDGLGTVVRRDEDGRWSTFWIQVPKSIAKQLASKGSIAVDGVSLTLVDVSEDQFSVALIPHTLEFTTLGTIKAGDVVNLETDVLAKYVQRQLEFLPGISN